MAKLVNQQSRKTVTPPLVAPAPTVEVSTTNQPEIQAPAPLNADPVVPTPPPAPTMQVMAPQIPAQQSPAPIPFGTMPMAIVQPHQHRLLKAPNKATAKI